MSRRAPATHNVAWSSEADTLSSKYGDGRETSQVMAISTWRDYLDLDDAALFAQCEFDRFRASGPGGQKRNRTASAVRLASANRTARRSKRVALAA